jgi:hypothetical protein
MEFTLVYQGPLKSNGSVKEKQGIRRELHKQLAELWKQEPLAGHVREGNILLEHIVVDGNPAIDPRTVIQEIGNFRFLPLVCAKLNLVAELNITFLRPEPPGRIVTQCGDIDNRLKTLFDALRMPREPNDIPKGDVPEAGENPFFCLLEDDNLITKVAVTTDRLLKRCENPSFVVLLITVRTRLTKMDWNNMDLG